MIDDNAAWWAFCDNAMVKDLGQQLAVCNGSPVGTCQVHGYKSIPVALLAAYEASQKADHPITVERNNGGTMDLVAVVAHAAD